VGNIDYRRIGGECAAPGNSISTFEVRAAMVGDDFFAVSSGANTSCHFHGRMRNGLIRGFEVCVGGARFPFAMRLSTEQTPGPDGR